MEETRKRKTFKLNSPPSNSITNPITIIDLTEGCSYSVRGIEPRETTPPSNSLTKPKTIIDLTQGFPYSVQEFDPPSNSINKPKTIIDLTDGFPYSVRELKAPNEVSKKHKRSITKVSCDICADEKFKDNMFTIVGCGHSYCSECVAKYVDSKLQENVVMISCPFLGCKGSLEPQNCQRILGKKVFDRWCDALCESLIVGSEKFYCPFKDCSALLIDDRFQKECISECECPECHRIFCGTCKVPWHLSLTCKEYQNLSKDERSNEDILLMNLAKKQKWIRCPHCGFYVQRSSGCLLIECRCGHGFCYNCGAPLKGHYCRKCKH